MSLVARNVLPITSPQVWDASNMTAGDVLGISESLGNRAAHAITIESIGGTTTVRFNVVRKIYKEYGQLHEPWVGIGQGTLRRAPVLVGEVKEAKPIITIDAGTVKHWRDEIAVVDIEIVSMSSGTRIEVE